jgi:hypothetical protein
LDAQLGQGNGLAPLRCSIKVRITIQLKSDWVLYENDMRVHDSCTVAWQRSLLKVAGENTTQLSPSDGRYQLFWFRYDTSPIPWILVDTDTKIDTDTQFFPFIKITFKTRTLMFKTSQRIL